MRSSFISLLVGLCACSSEHGEPSSTLLVADSLMFPSTGISTSKTADITLTNGGSVATGAIAAMTSGPFKLTASSCTTLEPDASCTLTIGFAPTTAGPHTGSLTITAEPGGSISVALLGEALPGPHFAGDYYFGHVLAYNMSHATTTMQFVNDSPATIPIDMIEHFSGPHTTTCGNSLAPGAACDITATWLPFDFGQLGSFVRLESAGTIYETPVDGLAVGFVSVNVTAGGRVTADPEDPHCGGSPNCVANGIDCPGPAQCSATYGYAAALYAVPEAGYHFVGWNALPRLGCTTDPVCGVPASWDHDNPAPTAEFAPN